MQETHVALEDQRQGVLARFFHGLSDPTRLRIIETLISEGELNVSQLVTLLGQPQSRVSNHLACLRWCGFVESRRDGKYVYYRIGDDRVRELVGLAGAIVADHSSAIMTCTRMG